MYKKNIYIVLKNASTGKKNQQYTRNIEFLRL